MNFLAHFFLSADSDACMVGNFVADYLTNREVAELPEPIQKGVFLHRQIDTYTDNHPLVRSGTERLRPQHGKYAPVVIDIFYDYLLATHWDRYSEESMPAFTRRVYDVLLEYAPELPLKMRKRIPGMVAADWLSSYGKLEGIVYTFERLKSRVSRPEFLDQAVDSLQEHEQVLTKGFHGFFPEAIGFVREVRDAGLGMRDSSV